MDRILMVDDDPEHLENMKQAAEGPGRTITTAVNRDDALGKISREEFDLVVTDLALTRNNNSDQGGLDVLEAATKRDEEVPVILVTSYASPDVARKAIRLDVFDVIDRGSTRINNQDILRHKIGLALRFRRALKGAHLTPA